MGVLNVTPDSFSDGGLYADAEAAVAYGTAMRDEGADLVDVGGESTRPGSDRVDADEETRRVLPVISELARAGVALSIDTTRAAVAAAALEAGAMLVNDVSGGLADPDLLRVVADARVPCVLMHWRGHSKQMNQLANYDDVVGRRTPGTVGAGRRGAGGRRGLRADRDRPRPRLRQDRRAQLGAAGAPRCADRPRVPGARRSLAEVLPRLAAGRPGRRAPRPPSGREDATTATTVLAALAGAWGVRVHRVRPNVDAATVVAAAEAARS